MIFRVPLGAAASTIGALFTYTGKGTLALGLKPGVYELRVVKEGTAVWADAIEFFVEVWTRDVIKTDGEPAL